MLTTVFLNSKISWMVRREQTLHLASKRLRHVEPYGPEFTQISKPRPASCLFWQAPPTYELPRESDFDHISCRLKHMAQPDMRRVQSREVSGATLVAGDHGRVVIHHCWKTEIGMAAIADVSFRWLELPIHRIPPVMFARSFGTIL